MRVRARAQTSFFGREETTPVMTEVSRVVTKTVVVEVNVAVDVHLN